MRLDEIDLDLLQSAHHAAGLIRRPNDEMHFIRFLAIESRPGPQDPRAGQASFLDLRPPWVDGREAPAEVAHTRYAVREKHRQGRMRPRDPFRLT